MYEEIYQKLGLSEEEAKMYQVLLEEGPKTAAKLAAATQIKRTYIYALVQGLVKKGLVSQEKTDQTTIFTAQSPDKLLELISSRQREVAESQRAIENVLPSLKSLYALSESKPVVTYFEGVEGVKKVYLDTLQEKKPIEALVETTKVHPEVYAWVTQEYAKSRVAAGIPVKAIVASGENTQIYRELDVKELRETKLIDSDKFPFEHEINLYGNKVAIINHRAESKLVGIIIDNPEIAKTFRSWFTLTWDLLN